MKLPLRPPVPPCIGWLNHNLQICGCYANDKPQPNRTPLVDNDDRLAAAALAIELDRPTLADRIKAGERDDHFLTQAFAKHRIATLGKAAAVAEGLRRLTPYEWNRHPCVVTMKRIATAIRALSTPPATNTEG